MKKLIEVEMDGQAAQQHVRELRDVIRRLREDNRISMTSAESVRLAKLKEAFFEKMADFEATNRALRRLLREHHRSEGEAARLAEQRELLLRKVADGDAYIEVCGLCASVILSLFLSLCAILCVSYSLYVLVSLSLSVTVVLSLCHCVFTLLSLSPLSFTLSLALCHTLSLSHTHTHAHT